MKIFVANTGSASKKYAFYIDASREIVMHFEHEGGGFVVTFIIDGKEEKRSISVNEFHNATEIALNELLVRKIINNKGEINAVGFRIVAPGIYFMKNRVVDGEYMKKLEAAKDEAPLHIGAMLEELANISRILPNVPVVGISDSTFHVDIPERARFYAIPKETAETAGIVRYGYHGISFTSILRKMTATAKIPEKIIICHLGSGSSIGAVKGGKSADTSMGFTPLEGIPMATRVGDIDPGAVIYIMKKFGFGPNELEEYLNTHCGLLGLSGQSDDLRTLIDAEKAGDKKAALAIDVLVYKIKKYIGAYTAALNGLDALIFSGTIGERSFFLRSRICRDMDGLGVVLDDERNNNTVSRDGFIQSASSKVKIAVMTTDEMGEIALETAQILK